MTLYDSSVLIDYLAGESTAVTYVENHQAQRAVAPQLVLFEVYQGEVFKSGPADFEAVDQALAWVTIVDKIPDLGRTAAELQSDLHRRGAVLAARDAFIAGAAKSLGEPLAVADSDFDIAALTDRLTVDILPSQE